MQNAGALCAVYKKPAVVRQGVSIGAESDIDIAAEDQQSGTLQMLFRDKRHPAIHGQRGIAAANRALNNDGPAKLFRAVGEVQSVQPMHDTARLAGGNTNVERAGREVDRRGAADADLGRNQSVGGLGDRVDSGRWVDEAAFPERRCGFSIGVKGVNTGMFGRHKHDIMFCARDGHVGHVQRLGINLAVHRTRE